ncbi:MAG: hypothetical protein A3J29_00580 [Acidobacteria bacterium RIFCSPLOWO2_12_FULL_67_14b]|nr:MAG: hypothetical protein A3J29_00580 [Acidobacteria bacterium RIFCSPLOWO2_12_FULL_67_14b]
MLLLNARSDRTIASDVTLALTRTERRHGLLGHDSLDLSAALVLSPCWSIHTMFMRFPIDVVFVDRDGRAVRIVRGLAPWRFAIAPRAHAVIELPAGILRARDVRVGDELYLVPPASPTLQVLRRPTLAASGTELCRVLKEDRTLQGS